MCVQIIISLLPTNINSYLAANKPHFKTATSRRKFLDEFAKSQKFNPLDDKKWYSVTRSKIRIAVSFVCSSPLSVFDSYIPGRYWIAQILWGITHQSIESALPRIGSQSAEFFKTLRLVSIFGNAFQTISKVILCQHYF
jgi:hypothetical protein